MKSTPKELYEKRIREEIKIYEEKIQEIIQVLLESQKKCKHIKTQFYPDASGNNDSYYECINCGKHI